VESGLPQKMLYLNDSTRSSRKIAVHFCGMREAAMLAQPDMASKYGVNALRAMRY
jgi:hypothetical protein